MNEERTGKCLRQMEHFVKQILHNGQLYYSKYKTICFIHNQNVLLKILGIIKSSEISFSNYTLHTINLIKTNNDDNAVNWNDNDMSCN